MRWTKPDKGEKRRMKMRFFESFKQADQAEKFHGKPLIKRYGLLSLPIDTIKGNPRNAFVYCYNGFNWYWPIGDDQQTNTGYGI